MELSDLPPLITVQDLVAVTIRPGENRKTRENIVRRQCESGGIPAVKLGKRWYMSRDEVLRPVLGGEDGQKRKVRREAGQM